MRQGAFEESIATGITEYSNDNIQELKINNARDRDAVIIALANAGYKVWTDRRKINSFPSDYEYYVLFEMIQ